MPRAAAALLLSLVSRMSEPPRALRSAAAAFCRADAAREGTSAGVKPPNCQHRRSTTFGLGMQLPVPRPAVAQARWWVPERGSQGYKATNERASLGQKAEVSSAPGLPLHRWSLPNRCFRHTSTQHSLQR